MSVVEGELIRKHRIHPAEGSVYFLKVILWQFKPPTNIHRPCRLFHRREGLKAPLTVHSAALISQAKDNISKTNQNCEPLSHRARRCRISQRNPGARGSCGAEHRWLRSKSQMLTPSVKPEVHRGRGG